MSCSITQPSAVHVLVTAAATDQGQFQTILKFRAHMPLDWLGEENEGVGGAVGSRDACSRLSHATHTLVHTHLACVLCLYELQNMHKSCAENLYLHFVLPVLFNNIWSANGWGGGRNGKRKVGERKRNSWNFEVSLPHAASVGVAVAVTVCAASKVLHFPTLHLFQCSKGGWRELAAAASCLFYFKCQII